ncbi:MAG: hypothetical protein ACREJN_17225 [Nitrospiraceae bacterium]
MRFRQFIVPPVILLVMSIGLFCRAEAKTVEAGHATVSWKGAGVIEDLGNGERVFSGAITGTLFVKHLPEGSAPAQIHATKLDCQAIFRISENGEERHSALCTIKAHGDKDFAYGEIRCVGKKDECKGEFTFVWGRGGFKGITGTTPYVGGIHIEEQKEGRIYGSAHWPEMIYTLP